MAFWKNEWQEAARKQAREAPHGNIINKDTELKKFIDKLNTFDKQDAVIEALTNEVLRRGATIELLRSHISTVGQWCHDAHHGDVDQQFTSCRRVLCKRITEIWLETRTNNEEF